MRRTWIGIWTVVLFAVVVSLVTWPVIGVFQTREQTQREIQRLEACIASMDEEMLMRQRNVARWYNLHFQTEDVSGTYDALLNFGGGIMGYLEIPALAVVQPICHGTEALGVTHDRTSALPIGGRGNLTAFTGLGDIADLSGGELIFIHILGQTHVYGVGEQGTDLCVLHGKSRTGQAMAVQCARLDPEQEQEVLSIPKAQQDLRQAVTIAVAAALGAGMIPLTVAVLRWGTQQYRRRTKAKL